MSAALPIFFILSRSARIDLKGLLETLNGLLEILNADAIGDTSLMTSTFGVFVEARGRSGNTGIGFMVKAASGYWNVSDPVNGFFAIRTATLRQMDFSRIADRFFFESSMLIELHYTGARISEVTMPAIYGDEHRTTAA